MSPALLFDTQCSCSVDGINYPTSADYSYPSDANSSAPGFGLGAASILRLGLHVKNFNSQLRVWLSLA
jgi:hypothetical protein